MFAELSHSDIWELGESVCYVSYSGQILFRTSDVTPVLWRHIYCLQMLTFQVDANCCEQRSVHQTVQQLLSSMVK